MLTDGSFEICFFAYIKITFTIKSAEKHPFAGKWKFVHVTVSLSTN
jgi:hypothetical protein